ncbi:MAG TPA: sugar nucleotide-binding protein, partial [Candidatus Saccharimonadia bacterium]|nr:sugar nucleotide-binding protein [Candidatus Saccharimonadia bacterium]
MRILLLGANGQVGFELHRSLAPLGELVAATRDGTLAGDGPAERADLADAVSLHALVARVAPAWVVNAAAYTAVDAAEDDAATAQLINGDALGAIGAAARAVGATVLHFSTDYVFAGDAQVPYREDD